MARNLTDLELAELLEKQQVDRTVLDEAARRIRNLEVRHLLTANQMIEAVHDSPLIDRQVKEIVEKTLLAVAPSRKTSSRISSLGGKILAGGGYTHQDVLSLAASVVSQDEKPGQS